VGYFITPGCLGPNGETLALAATESGQIVVQDASLQTSAMFWSLIYDNQSGGFAMVNLLSSELGTTSILTVVAGQPTLSLQPIVGGLSSASTWDVVAGGNALAVRPTMSTSLNLNVAGNGPYPPGSPVIAYNGWGGGQPNEIWTFQDAGTQDYPWNYSLAPECNPETVLAANPDNALGQLTIQTPNGPDDEEEPSPAQLWSANYLIEGTTPLGVVFTNEETSMIMQSTPGGGPVSCTDSGQAGLWSTWTIGSAQDEGYSTIRTGSSTDPQTYLTVSGSSGPFPPGTTVIAGPWQGGSQMQAWLMTAIPHEVT
jgi:hypothetical protein